jgi:hypothetical protein
MMELQVFGQVNDDRLFHQNIQEGNVENLKTFIDEFPTEKLVYDENNNSAVAVSLNAEQFEAYEFLISNGFKLGLHESFEEILTKLDRKQESSKEAKKKRTRLRLIHNKYVKESSKKHLYKLNVKSKLSHYTDDDSRKRFEEEIVIVFEELSELMWIEIMLKYVANSKTLQIIFDFYRESVEVMDPTKHRFVFGTTYPRDACIYIGAKKLLNNRERSEVLGTLAHELCHLTMGMLYGNNCKPYTPGDDAKEQEFNRIVMYCQEDKHAEDIISHVFDYPPSKWHAELIVRVPHLM